MDLSSTFVLLELSYFIFVRLFFFYFLLDSCRALFLLLHFHRISV